MREKVIKAIEIEKIIAIVRGVEKNKLIPLARSLYDGGIRLIEITYSADKSVSDEETAENIKMLRDEFDGKMYVGAGTVLTKEQVRLTKNAGGLFIISPDTNREVIEETVKCGLVSLPGALTPSEIRKADLCGADFVKVFPADNLGCGYIKAVKAPLSNIKLLAVGGVDENNMKSYIDIGVSGFGIGSNIVKKSLIDAGKFDKITELAKKYTLQIEK